MLTAGQFVTSIPQQQKYLSGENYYDNCPFNDNKFYLMGTFSSYPLGEQLFLSLEQDSSTLKMMPYVPYTHNSYPNQEWRFKKIGRGWWKITNRAKGDGYALDTGVMDRAGGFTGQYWRCMPTRLPGWVRLINSHTGELKSLDFIRNTYKASMADTGEVPGQHWRFRNADHAQSWAW